MEYLNKDDLLNMFDPTFRFNHQTLSVNHSLFPKVKIVNNNDNRPILISVDNNKPVKMYAKYYTSFYDFFDYYCDKLDMEYDDQLLLNLYKQGISKDESSRKLAVDTMLFLPSELNCFKKFLTYELEDKLSWSTSRKEGVWKFQIKMQSNNDILNHFTIAPFKIFGEIKHIIYYFNTVSTYEDLDMLSPTLHLYLKKFLEDNNILNLEFPLNDKFNIAVDFNNYKIIEKLNKPKIETNNNDRWEI